ncbi:MAG: putative metalloprotease [Alphaproteobacteria bacterium]|nr:putative metalloprotease [Alphaproteobacteria bacterium]
MLWQSGRRSENVSDRRGIPGGVAGGGGLLMLGIGVVVALLGGDPSQFFAEGLSRTLQTRTEASHIPQAQQDEMVDFVKVVLGGTEDVWRAKFQAMGGQYADPQMVIFSGAVNSACGRATRAVGPFYCPNDQTVYIDLEFFNELKTRFGAPGDFAQAYVIAHEVGHHVQNLTGVFEQTERYGRSNETSVKTELMADCLAGIWAHETQNKGLLESGDVEEALNAASHIGDDALQKQTQGVVVPDSFTHGSSAQRYQWFRTGYETGDMERCNTFR